MNLLTTYLVESVLGESKNIVLFPGGFKPPTYGHFFLLQETLKKYPTIDEVLILIGPLDRNNITQEDSKFIWEIYLKHINIPSQIILSEKSPISDVFNIVGENPQNNYLGVVGWRDSSDLRDLGRFDRLEKKYENFHSIKIQGPDIRATDLRKSLKNKNYSQFIKNLPITELTPEEINVIWDRLSSKEIINEADKGYRAGRIDFSKPAETLGDKGIGLGITNSKVGLLGTGFYFVGNKEEVNKLLKKGYNKYTEIDLSQYNLYKPEDPEEFYEGIKNVTSQLHELKPQDLKNHDTKEDIKNLKSVLSNFFDIDFNKVDEIVTNYIKDIITKKDGELLSNRLLKTKGYDGVDLTDTQYDNFGVGSVIFLDKIKKQSITTKDKEKAINEWSLPVVDKETEIKFWALYYSLFEKLEKAYNQNNLDEKYNELKQSTQLGSFERKAIEYFYDVIKNERIPLNESFRKIIFKKKHLRENLSQKPSTLEEAIKSINEFFKQNSIKVEPTPQLHLLEDEENGKELLGKTAFYNPNDNSINLYTTNRHSKDILRSYCHELIHLHQDREGRIPNITTENVNEDDVLLELEKEAYLMGNILMRQWENNFKK